MTEQRILEEVEIEIPELIFKENISFYVDNISCQLNSLVLGSASCDFRPQFDKLNTNIFYHFGFLRFFQWLRFKLQIIRDKTVLKDC